MKKKKEKALQQMILTSENSQQHVPKHSPFKTKFKYVYSSFVCQRSAAVHKLLTNKASTAVAILKHVWDQEYKDPKKRVYMNKYWKRCNNDLAKIMLDIGKSKGKKDDKKLLAAVNKEKRKYKSLHQASKLVDILWTTFHRQTYIKCNKRRKLGYFHKLTEAQVNDIQSHFTSDDISFPLPDKIFEGKCFMHNSVQKSLKMYNLLASTTCKISLATYYRCKPKSVKFQGKIPFHQSCCKKCQNIENIIEQGSKYMANIPRDLGGCVDRTLCDYHGYFPNFKCVICKCKNCGSSKFLHQILESNADKLSDKRNASS